MSRFSSLVFRSTAGYRWVRLGGNKRDGGKDREDHLYLQAIDLEEAIDDNNPFFPWPGYDPFETEPALFRIFAAIEPTEEAILEFANRYGSMFSQVELLKRNLPSLAYWKEQIKAMRNAIQNSEKLLSRGKSRKALEELWILISHELDSVHVCVDAQIVGDQIAIQIAAGRLEDVMKLQLYEAIAERKRYRECEFCSKPFELSPQVNRADRVFCSANCRVKAYQRRRKQAIEMWRKGKAARAIAKATSTDIAKVKSWIEEAQSKETK